MPQVYVTFWGVAQLRDLLHICIRNARPDKLTETAAGLGVIALREHDQYFKREMSPGMVPWQALSPVTLKLRYQRTSKNNKTQRNVVFTWRILQDRGWLVNSVTPGTSTEEPRPGGIAPGFYSSALGAIRDVDARGFSIGTNLPYAWKQQHGDPGGQRFVVDIPKHQRRAITVRSHFRVVDGIRGTVAAHARRAHEVRAHQSNRITRPIPARPYVGFSDMLIDKSMRFLADSLVPVDTTPINQIRRAA